MEENLHVFDAGTLIDGFFPMPKTLSAGAANLLSRFLWKAFEASSRFAVLNLTVRLQLSQEVEDVCHELLRSKFPMPCAGADEPITMIDSIAMQPGELRIQINAVFASYVLSTARVPESLRRLKDEVAPKPLPLYEADHALVVESLQRCHYFGTVQWNEHAKYAVTHGHPVQPRETFGLDRFEALLARLGASTAP